MKRAILLLLVACAEQPPGVMSCEQIHDTETYELVSSAGSLWCEVASVPHGAEPYSSADLLEPVPPGIGRFYVGPTRYFGALDNTNKVGVLVRIPSGGCAWVSCDGGINPIDTGTP